MHKGKRLAGRGWRASGTIALAAVTIGALVAGCGSSSTATSSSKTTTSGGSAPSSSSGPVYHLTTIQDPAGTNAQYVAEGTSAAIDAINADGGIHGHKLTLTTCMTNNDPNTAAQCARTAVADKSNLGVVDEDTSYSAQIDPILAAAGMPLVGGIPFSNGDDTSPIAFNTNPGAAGTGGEGVMVVNQLHGTKVGLPYVGVPAGAEVVPLVQAIIKPFGGTVVGNVAIPITAADVTSQAAAVQAAHPSAIVDGLLTPQMVQFIQTYRQMGGTAPFVVGINELSAQEIKKSLSGANQNIYADSWFDEASAGYKQYLADITKYQPKALQDNTDLVAAAWLGIDLFKSAAAAGSSTLTRTSLLSALKSMTNFTDGGMTPPIDFAKPQTALGGSFRRIPNPNYYPVKYENGSWVSINKWTAVNLFTGKSQ